MSDKQAFPCNGMTNWRDEPADDRNLPPQQGMSLREWYAGQALMGLCANPNLIKSPEDFAENTQVIVDGLWGMCGLIADKMVEEKQQ